MLRHAHRMQHAIWHAIVVQFGPARGRGEGGTDLCAESTDLVLREVHGLARPAAAHLQEAADDIVDIDILRLDLPGGMRRGRQSQ